MELCGSCGTDVKKRATTTDFPRVSETFDGASFATDQGAPTALDAGELRDYWLVPVTRDIGMYLGHKGRSNFIPLVSGLVLPPLGELDTYVAYRDTSLGGDVYFYLCETQRFAEAVGRAVSHIGNERLSRLEETGTSSANTADTITLAAVTNTLIVVTGIYVFTEGGPTGSDVLVELEDGTTPIWQAVIGQGAPRGAFVGGESLEWPITLDAAANLQVAAGGASVVTRSSVVGFRIPAR